MNSLFASFIRDPTNSTPTSAVIDNSGNGGGDPPSLPPPTQDTLPDPETLLKRKLTHQLAIGAAAGHMDKKEATKRCEQAHENAAGSAFDKHIAHSKGRLHDARHRAKQAQDDADEAKAQRDQCEKFRRNAFNPDYLHKKPYSPRDVVEMVLMLAAVLVSMVVGIGTVANIVMSDFGFSGSRWSARGYGSILFVLPTFAIAGLSTLAKSDERRLLLIRLYAVLGFIGLFGFIITFALAKTPLPTVGDPLDLSLDMDALGGLTPEEPWWKTFIAGATEFISEVRPLLNLPLTMCIAVSEIFFAITVKSVLLRKLDIHGWPYRPKAQIAPEYAAHDKEYRKAQRMVSAAEAELKDCEESLRQAEDRRRRYCEEVKNLALAAFMARYAEIKALQSQFDD